MIDTSPLRRRLLDLAVTGRLTADFRGDATGRAARPRAAALTSQTEREESFSRVDRENVEKGDPLPPGWRMVRLGDVGDWGAGATPSRGNKAYFANGSIPWVKTGDLNDGLVTDVPESITQKALEETSVRLNPIGSVLIAMYGATIGKVGILGVEATTNQACCACQTNEKITKEYLFYFLLSQREKFKKLGGGGAQPNISKQIITQYPLPLPPLSEQKEIVRRLEGMLARERGIAEDSAALDALVAAAKRKILQLAVSGKLISRGDRENGENGDALPVGWKMVDFGDIVDFNMGKTPPRANDEYWTPAKYHWVSITDMIPGGVVLNTKYSVSETAASAIFGKRISKAGTLIMSFKLTIGRVSILGVDAYHNEAIISIHPKDDAIVSRDYLKTVLPLVALRAKTSPAVMGDTLNKKSLSQMKVPLPPLAEQKAIVAKVDALFAALDAMRG